MRKEELENIIAVMPGHVYWKDENGSYLGCNDLQAQALGLSSREDIVKKVPYEHLPENDRKILQNIDMKVMKSGKIRIIEEPGILQNGEKGVFLSHKVPLRDKNGKIIGLLGVSFDITERKRLQEELSNERLEIEKQKGKVQTMKAMGASIAHELRTPLRSIICGADSIADNFPELMHGYELAKEAGLPVKLIYNKNLTLLKEVSSRITREAAFANTVVEMLLMNIKETDVTLKDFTTLSALHCVGEALNRYPFQIRQKSWVVWEADAKNDFKFHGSNLLFEHVIFNLMKNALYYVEAADKGDDGRIYIKLENGEKENKLYFKDTGKGISKAILPKIFDDFFSETMHGTGIGLSFCKMAMEQMNGSIVCRSKEDEFTEFVLTFPVS